MAADYYTLLTNAGIAYETACKANGQPIKLTKMSVGDGNGAVYNPDATASALKREVWRGDINALLPDANNPSWLVAELDIPNDVGGWSVREAGIWTDTGILYAVIKYPESYKPVMATSGAGKEFYIRAIFQTTNASSVTLLVDESVVKATRLWVADYVAGEINKLDAKKSVRVVATSPITLSGAQQIDSVAAVAGDRVLATAQASAKDNGIWVVANGDWVRASDADTSLEVTPGLIVSVEEGAIYTGSLWELVTAASITLGTTALVFEQIAGRLASKADALAGVSGARVMTPVRASQAAQYLTGTTAADDGAANAYVGKYSPAVTELKDQMILRLKVAASNSGASTFKPNDLAAAPIVGLGSTALQGGEIVAGGEITLQWNSSIGGGSWVLLSSSGGALQVPAAAKAGHAVNLGQLALLKGIQRFTSSGNFIVPAGVYVIWASGCAAGGGGGSTLATNSVSYLTGGGGGGAGQSVRRFPIAVTPGQVIPVTIGAPGIGGTPAANNATDGGATQLGTAGALLNLLGGSRGGIGSGGTVYSQYGGPPGGAGYPAGSWAADTNVFSVNGQIIATGGNGGVGGSSLFGIAGPPGRGAAGTSVAPRPGTGYGAGGSGAGGAYASAVSSPGMAGGDGLPGYMEIEW
jgi:phage-related tail fiber protein